MIDATGPILAAGSAGTGLLALAAYLRNRRLPEGATHLATPGGDRQAPRAITGSVMLVVCGDYGTNEALRVLKTLHQCGIDEAIGSILVAQFAAQKRSNFAAETKDYADRIVYAFHEDYEDGFGNRSAEKVLDESEAWAPVMDRVTRELIYLHEQRNESRAPGLILFFVSPGGHLPVGLVPAQILHERYRAARLVAATPLAHMTRLRERFLRFKALYEQSGIHGWLLTDTLGPDPETADWALAGLIAGVADVSISGRSGVQPVNVLNLALPEKPGGILIWHTVYDNIVAFPWQRVPGLSRRHYFLIRQALIAGVQRELRQLDAGSGIPSVELPTGEPGTAKFTIVLLPLYHSDISDIADEVRAGREKRAQLLASTGQTAPDSVTAGRVPDHELIFASVAVQVNKQRPAAPLVALRLASVWLDAAPLEEIIKPPADRSLDGARQLAASSTTLLPEHAPARDGMTSNGQ